MAKQVKKEIGKSTSEKTHFASFPLTGRVPLQNFRIPTDLYNCLKNGMVERENDSDLCRDYAKLFKALQNVQQIRSNCYLELFKIFLYVEEYEFQNALKKYNLMNYKLTSTTPTFVVEIPNMDVDEPFIGVDHTVIIQNFEAKKNYRGTVTDIKEKLVTVTLDNKDHIAQISNTVVNIKFNNFNWPIACSHFALNTMSRRNVTHILYPKVKPLGSMLPQLELQWFNKQISNNPEQKQAVYNILNKSAHPAPYILFGPPGTGKTATLVEAVCQIWNTQKSYILICAPSNSAADEITKRLLATIPAKDMFRMYAKSKNWNTLDEQIDPCSNFVEDRAVFIPKELLLTKKIVITTLVTSIRLTTLNLHSDHFSYVFIDEASQSLEPEVLIPITLTTETRDKIGTFYAQVVIVGDPFQLGPIVLCKQIEHLYGKSILQRLMECDPYKKTNNKYDARYLTKLIRNYRSRKPILRVSNELFYEEELVFCGEVNSKTLTLNWPGLLNKTFPIIFYAVHGTEIRTENRSVYNKEEIAITMDCIQRLLTTKNGSCNFKRNNIGIVTPFKQQVNMIRRKLNANRWGSINVGTVEVFQGREKDVIILSTVRSRSFVHDNKEHIGFLSNPKKFNVAVTRAKKLLIVIGNPAILSMTKCWNMLWNYCEENNACVTLDDFFVRSVMHKHFAGDEDIPK